MPQKILDSDGDLLVVSDKSTVAITCSFTDENGDAVTPNADSTTWTLTNQSGTVVNSRSSEAVASGSSITIVLSNGDTEYLGSGDAGTREVRILTVECTYNSDLGSNLPLKKSGYFMVENCIAIT